MRYILFLAVFLMMAPAFAGEDDGLYTPLPPPGSAFVRYINASDKTQPVLSSGKKHAEVDALSVSSYFAVKQGDVALTLGETSVRYKLEGAKFYTVLQGADGPMVVEDPVTDDRSKAQILFYNLAAEDIASLKTQDGATDVVAGVGPFSVGVRPINPVKVKLAAFKGAQASCDFGEVSLERGMVYSAICTEGAAKIWVRSTTDSLH